MLGWLNPNKRILRWTIKLSLLLVLVLLALFPRVDLLPVTISRWSDANSLIDPHSEALEPLVAEFELERNPDWTQRELMNHIEAFVYRAIPYSRDWNLWANIDYIPTVEETIAKGKEDCDGRAVVAASMLQYYGFDAELVGNFDHMWVKTQIGEAMGSGGTPLVTHTDDGDKIDWGAFWDIPDDFSHGIAIFPLWREMIILLGVWILMIGKGARLQWAALSLLLLTAGLLLIRDGGNSDDLEGIKNWGGLLLILLTALAMIRKSSLPAKRWFVKESIRPDIVQPEYR